MIFLGTNCVPIGTIKQARISSNAPSIWLYNQSTWSQCLCYALQHPPVVAFNSYALNSSCQLFLNLSTSAFQIVNKSNVTIYLLQPLSPYAPCCSNLTWLRTQIQSTMTALSMNSATSVVLDTNNNRLAAVASAVLRSVSATSFTALNVSVNLPTGSQVISYHQNLYYIGIFPPSTPYMFHIYSASNFTKVSTMSFTTGGPQRIIWLFKDTLICVLTQKNPATTSKANFFNWPSNTLNKSVSLSIPNAYGLGKAPNNDSYIFITDGSWGGDVWQLKTTSPFTFTLFATTASSSESPVSVTVDGCNRLWVVFVNFGIRIFNINSRSLLMAWNLTSTFPELYDLVLTNQYQLYLADKTAGLLAHYGSPIQCTN